MSPTRASWILALICFMAGAALGRPVSYAGGWTFIEESDRQSSSVLLHYTPTYQWSIGPRIEVNRDQNFTVSSVQPTWLAKRWFLVRTIRAICIFLVAPASLRVSTATPSIIASQPTAVSWPTGRRDRYLRVIEPDISTPRTLATNSCRRRGLVLLL